MFSFATWLLAALLVLAATPSPTLAKHSARRTSISSCLLRSNAIQLAVKNHDAQVAQVVFEKVPVIEFRRLLTQVNWFEFEIFNFTHETVAGRSHNVPLSQKRFEPGPSEGGGKFRAL